jgi:hypothetical protein
MKKAARALRILAISSLGFAGFFGLLSLTLYFGDWDRLLIVVAFGLFFGLVAAPNWSQVPSNIHGCCRVPAA